VGTDGFNSSTVPPAWPGAPTNTSDRVCGWEAGRGGVFSVCSSDSYKLVVVSIKADTKKKKILNNNVIFGK